MARNIKAKTKDIVSPAKKQDAPITLPKISYQREGTIKKMPHYAQIWGRDPFIGELVDIDVMDIIDAEDETEATTEIEYLEGYNWTATSFRGKSPTILVDKEVLKIGDKLDGMTLQSVDGSSAFLTMGSQRYILKMKGSL